MVGVPSGFPLVVVGAGQAGLAVSYELTNLGIEHVVLERARIGQTWRGLWDSFCLVMPNWTTCPAPLIGATTQRGSSHARRSSTCSGTHRASVRRFAREPVDSLEPGPNGGFLLRPAALPVGKILVVGSGQTGCQISGELHESGREVFLACGRAPWLPRRVDGRDIVTWLSETTFFDTSLNALPSPAARLGANLVTAGMAAMTCTTGPCRRWGCSSWAA